MAGLRAILARARRTWVQSDRSHPDLEHEMKNAVARICRCAAGVAMVVSLAQPARAQSPEFARPAAVSRAALVAKASGADGLSPVRAPIARADTGGHSVWPTVIGVVVGGVGGAWLGSKIKTEESCYEPSCDVANPTEGVGVAFAGIFIGLMGAILGGIVGSWVGGRM
jgi:hypothetical protein